MELKEGMSVLTPGGEEVGHVNRFVLVPAGTAHGALVSPGTLARLPTGKACILGALSLRTQAVPVVGGTGCTHLAF